MSRSILFVGFVNSPHTARWIDLIADKGWDLHFFPVYQMPPHPNLRNVTLHHPWLSFHPRLWIKNAFNSLFLGLLPKQPILHTATYPNINVNPVFRIPVTSILENKLHKMKTAPLGESDVRAMLPFGPYVLAQLIKKLKPDLIHSMEFQHAGYTVLKTKELLGNNQFPKWLATNWGSDIYYYKNFPDHKKQITRLLQNIDYYSCECERDITQAKDLGMKTDFTTTLLNTGGFDIERIKPVRNSLQTSKRRIIMVKGYQHFAGRALTALDALSKCADLLKDYRIIVYSTSAEVYEKIEELRLFYDLNIQSLGPLDASHEKMLRLFAHARIYLGVSISDAISTSMLEAMAMGAFPIQTNTACCDEWIKDGETGFSIPPDDINFIAQRIREALLNDELVNKAAELNWQVVCDRLDKIVIRKKEVALYDQIFSQIGK